MACNRTEKARQPPVVEQGNHASLFFEAVFGKESVASKLRWCELIAQKRHYSASKQSRVAYRVIAKIARVRNSSYR